MKLDKYKLVVQDEYNIKLSEEVLKKEAFGKIPKEGETSEKIIGYYGSLSGALRKIVNLELNSKTDTNTLENVLEQISALETSIESIAEGLKAKHFPAGIKL